jgi:hypothetical protein
MKLLYAYCSSNILVLITEFGVIISRDCAIPMFGQQSDGGLFRLPA